MAFALTLSELAQWVDGDIVRGGLDLSLTGMAALDTAGPHDVSFLGNEKYHSQFLETKAAAVIVPRGVTDGPEEHRARSPWTIPRSPSPSSSATSPPPPGLSLPASIRGPSSIPPPRSIRQKSASSPVPSSWPVRIVGDGSDIGPNCVIGDDAVIGKDCHIMANATVRERCVLGDRVILQPGAVIGSDGYGYEFSEGRHVKIDQVGIVEIGDDVEIGANTTIDRARFGKTIIGEGTKIDNLVQIGHNCVIGKHCLIVALTGISGSTRLGDYVTVAGQVGIVGHVTIGDKAQLSGRTGVTTNLAGDDLRRPSSPAVPRGNENARQRPPPAEAHRAGESARRSAADCHDRRVNGGWSILLQTVARASRPPVFLNPPRRSAARKTRHPNAPAVRAVGRFPPPGRGTPAG